MAIPLLKVNYVAVFDDCDVVHFELNDILPLYENEWKTISGNWSIEDRVRDVLGHRNFRLVNFYGYWENGVITECDNSTFSQIVMEREIL